MSVKQTDPRAAVRTLVLYFRDVWLAFTKTTNTFLVYTAVLQRNAWANSLPTLRNVIVVSLKGSTQAHCVYMDGYGADLDWGLCLQAVMRDSVLPCLTRSQNLVWAWGDELFKVLNTAICCSSLLCDTNSLIFLSKGCPPSTTKILVLVSMYSIYAIYTIQQIMNEEMLEDYKQ